MTTQMIIRIDSETKTRLNRLARVEGKTTSQMVRESDRRLYQGERYWYLYR